MQLTPHPFQRVGAHSAAILSGRERPEDITDDDLDLLVERIATDALVAAGAAKGAPGWAWFVRLFAMFPNSPPVHGTRAVELVHDRVAAQFAPDDQAARTWPCRWCGEPAGARWGKSLWPLAESTSHLNGSPDGLGGTPTCRRCRIAVWCLPYGAAWVKGHLQTVTCVGDDALERAVAAANVEVSCRALAEGWRSWDDAPAADEVLVAALLKRGEPAAAEIQRWTAGNREPEMTISHLGERPSWWLITAYAQGYGPWLERLAEARWHHPLVYATESAAYLLRAVKRPIDWALEAPHTDQALAAIGPWLRLATARAQAEYAHRLTPQEFGLPRAPGELPAWPEAAGTQAPGVQRGRPAKTVTAWGQEWSLPALAKDPRCRVSYHTLRARIIADWTAEKAAETPPARGPRQA